VEKAAVWVPELHDSIANLHRTQRLGSGSVESGLISQDVKFRSCSSARLETMTGGDCVSDVSLEPRVLAPCYIPWEQKSKCQH
jgi:hypothetical protein